MAYYRPRLPYGLPADLTQRMLGPGRGGVSPVQYDQALGGLGKFSFKKLGRFVGKTASKMTRLVTAPVKALTLAPIKAATYVAKKAGVRVQKFDSYLHKQQQAAIKDTKAVAPIVIGAAAGAVTFGAGWALAAKAGADLLDASMPKSTARTAAPPDLAPENPMPSIADQANATAEVATTPMPGQQPRLPNQPDPAKVKALQAGMLPFSGSMPLIVGGIAVVGLAAILLSARSKPPGNP